MPRPARPQWQPRQYARQRHRTWMQSMVCASLGWAVWWTSLLLLRLDAGWVPTWRVTGVVSDGFAVAGLVLWLLTLRGSRGWLLLGAVPLFANASLLLLPWILPGLVERPG